MQPMERFREITSNPAAYAEKWKASTGGKIVGTFCSYTPVEIIYAGNALCYRALGSGNDVSLADIHLQAYCCNPVREILNDVLAKRLDFLDGVVFPHTCDSMQRLSDIWRLNTGFAFHEDFVLPVKLNTLSAQQYIMRLMETFQQKMESHLNTKITAEKLHSAIRKVNRIRDILKRLDSLRWNNPEAFTSSDMYTVVYASMIMDPEEWIETAEPLIIIMEADNTAPAVETSPKKILLSGSICGSANIHELIEENGGMVIHDDMCTGARFFEGIVEEHNNPLAALALRYLQRLNCPSKHNGIYSRSEHLLNIIRVQKADGVIFLLLKFCDPHAFDYPCLKQTLDDQQIPSLLIEADTQFALGEQISNRIQAFLEML